MWCSAEKRTSVITGLEAELTLPWPFSLSESTRLGQQPSYSEGPWKSQAQSGEVAKAFSHSQALGAWWYSVRNVECGDHHKRDLINSAEWSSLACESPASVPTES